MSLERFDIRIEVESDSILLVFPRKTDNCIVPWQQAMQLGSIMELAASDCNPQIVISVGKDVEDQAQIKLNTYKVGMVAMFWDWTDRLRFTPSAAVLVARAIRKVAQDALYTERGVFLEYVEKGPDKGMVKRLVNRKLGYEQIVRE